MGFSATTQGPPPRRDAADNAPRRDGPASAQRRCLADAVAQRRDTLIAAAERVFCKRGYHDSTMDDVAAAAGISKRTLYQLVESKDELFTALLARHRHPFDLAVATENRPIEDVLHEMLSNWANHILSPPILSLLRVIMADNIHGKTLSRMLDREYARKCRETTVTYLARCHGDHRLIVPDPEAAAQMLFGMAIGSIHIELLLGVGEAPSSAELDRRIQAAIALFLDGTRFPPAGARPQPGA